MNSVVSIGAGPRFITIHNDSRPLNDPGPKLAAECSHGGYPPNSHTQKGMAMKNKGPGARIVEIFGRVGRHVMFPVAATMCLGVTGCDSSGSANGVGSPGSQPSSPRSTPFGRATVVVTPVDPLGAPMVGADVRIYTRWTNEDKRAVTDANGRAEFTDVVAESVTIAVHGPDSWGSALTSKLKANDVYSFRIETGPAAEPTGGVARAWVSEGGLSGDGRALEFSLQIIEVPDPRLYEYGPGPWANTDFQMLDCTPDPGNDAAGHQPDCVSGPAGFDAPYTAVESGAALEWRTLPETTTTFDAEGYPTGTRFAAALLLDQSAGMIVDDPADKRLFAAKYLLNSLARDSIPTVLGAYAADQPSSDRFSALPQKPLSLFPLENPQYTTDGRSYFGLVDSLAVMEGGAPTLLEAVDRTLNFNAVSPGPTKRAIVVVAAGRDETCGQPADCRRATDSLVAKIHAAGVAVVTIGLGREASAGDHTTLGLLAQAGEGGASFWVDDPSQLAPTLAAAKQYLSELKPTIQVRFRLESAVTGAFAPGRTVTGRVRYAVVCPFDCVYASVPFVLTIPEAE